MAARAFDGNQLLMLMCQKYHIMDANGFLIRKLIAALIAGMTGLAYVLRLRVDTCRYLRPRPVIGSMRGHLCTSLGTLINTDPMATRKTLQRRTLFSGYIPCCTPLIPGPLSARSFI